MAGIVNGKSQTLYSIGGMPDQVHLLIGYKPSISVSDLVRDIKSNSSAFANLKMYIDKEFQWRSGFGAFIYGKSQLSDVIVYIENQQDHHKHQTFREEYIQFLKSFGVDFDLDYLFECYK